jgi:RNA polymerase sigma factor (sigma-70 family)
MPELLEWIQSRIDEFPKYLRHQLKTLDVQYLSDITSMERVDIKSLDEPNAYGQSFSEYVATDTPQPGDALDREALYAQLYKLMQHLTDREMACIRLRFGFDGLIDGRSLEDVGLLVGYSRERIRQIQSRALEKLRGLPEAQVLFETLEGIEL